MYQDDPNENLTKRKKTVIEILMEVDGIFTNDVRSPSFRWQHSANELYDVIAVA